MKARDRVTAIIEDWCRLAGRNSAQDELKLVMFGYIEHNLREKMDVVDSSFTPKTIARQIDDTILHWNLVAKRVNKQIGLSLLREGLVCEYLKEKDPEGYRLWCLTSPSPDLVPNEDKCQMPSKTSRQKWVAKATRPARFRSQSPCLD